MDATDSTDARELSPNLSVEELGPWLWLSDLSYVGPAIFSVLINAFDNPLDVHRAENEEIQLLLENAPGIRKSVWSRALKSLEEQNDSFERAHDAAERILGQLKKIGAVALRLTDPLYPPLLKRQVNAAPPILYARGRLDTGTDRGLAIVGTRGVSETGFQSVRTFALEAADQGWTVISGAAAGVDRAAHEGALESTKETIAVLGCGIDRIYPSQNKDLYQALYESGLVVSEYPPGVRPSGTRLRKRNKITAGFADAVVMGECPEGSGTLIAAQASLDQSKPVFVLPIPDPSHKNVQGSFRLLAWGKAQELQSLSASELERRLDSSPDPDPLVTHIRSRWPVIKAQHTRGQMSSRTEQAWREAFAAWDLSGDLSFSDSMDELGESLVVHQALNWRSLINSCKCILFDLDGVVVRVNEVLKDTLYAVLEEHLGPEAPTKQEIQELLGYHPRTVLRTCVREAAPSAIKSFQRMYKSGYLRESHLEEGMRKVLDGLRQANCGLGLITSQPRSRAAEILQMHRMDEYFQVVITWNDVGRPKPSPEGLLQAIKAIGANPTQCIYVGDGQVDIRAARAANIPSVCACWDRPLGPAVVAEKPALLLFEPHQLTRLG